MSKKYLILTKLQILHLLLKQGKTTNSIENTKKIIDSAEIIAQDLKKLVEENVDN